MERRVDQYKIEIWYKYQNRQQRKSHLKTILETFFDVICFLNICSTFKGCKEAKYMGNKENFGGLDFCISKYDRMKHV